jgi:hypothetical protein
MEFSKETSAEEKFKENYTDPEAAKRAKEAQKKAGERLNRTREAGKVKKTGEAGSGGDLNAAETEGNEGVRAEDISATSRPRGEQPEKDVEN